MAFFLPSEQESGEIHLSAKNLCEARGQLGPGVCPVSWEGQRVLGEGGSGV